MLPGKRDFYRCCKARRSASQVNKEFWKQFQNYAPPSLRVIRTKFARTIIGERDTLMSVQLRIADIYIYSILHILTIVFHGYAYRGISAHIPRRDLVIFCVLHSH